MDEQQIRELKDKGWEFVKLLHELDVVIPTTPAASKMLSAIAVALVNASAVSLEEYSSVLDEFLQVLRVAASTPLEPHQKLHIEFHEDKQAFWIGGL